MIGNEPIKNTKKDRAHTYWAEAHTQWALKCPDYKQILLQHKKTLKAPHPLATIAINYAVAATTAINYAAAATTAIHDHL